MIPGGWRIRDRDVDIGGQFCPRQQVTPWSWYMLHLYAAYQDGHLPAAGGVADQPYKVMQAFQVIAARKALIAEARARGKKA